MTEAAGQSPPDAFDAYMDNLDRPLWPGIIEGDFEAVWPRVEAYAQHLDIAYFTLDALSEHLESMRNINIGLPPEEDEWMALAQDMMDASQEAIDAEGRPYLWINRVDGEGVTEYSLARRVSPEEFATIEARQQQHQASDTIPQAEHQVAPVTLGQVQGVRAEATTVEPRSREQEIAPDSSRVIGAIVEVFGGAISLQSRQLILRVADRLNISPQAAGILLDGAADQGLIFYRAVKGRRGYSLEAPERPVTDQQQNERLQQPLSNEQVRAAMRVMDELCSSTAQPQKGETVRTLESHHGEELSRDAFRKALRALGSLGLLYFEDPKTNRKARKSPRILLTSADIRDVWTSSSRDEHEARLRALGRSLEK